MTIGASWRRGLGAAAAAALLAWLPATSAAAGPVASPVLTRYPYLTDMTATGVSVDFATDTVSPHPVVRWGPSGGGCQASTATVIAHKLWVAGQAEYQFAAPISGLRPHASYCYRVQQAGVDLLGGDPSPAFTTFVPAGPTSSFSFAVLGDWGAVGPTGVNPDQANLLGQVARSGASFIVTAGDNSYPSGNQTNYGDLQHTGYETSAVFGPGFWKRVGMGIPAFLTMGNHGMNLGQEYLVDWPQPATVAASAGRYQLDFDCCLDGSRAGSYPSAWYAFDYGQARFYVLEAAWAEGNSGSGTLYQLDHDYHWTPASPEYRWLQADLAAHASTPLKFAFFHFPLHTDNVVAAPSDTLLQGPGGLEGLLSSNGVTIAFTGHAHIYERNLPVLGPMVSYVTGGGGAPLHQVASCSAFDAYALGWSYAEGAGLSCRARAPAWTSQVYHFLLVRVSGTSATVVPTDESGGTFDVQTYRR